MVPLESKGFSWSQRKLSLYGQDELLSSWFYTCSALLFQMKSISATSVPLEVSPGKKMTCWASPSAAGASFRFPAVASRRAFCPSKLCKDALSRNAQARGVLCVLERSPGSAWCCPYSSVTAAVEPSKDRPGMPMALHLPTTSLKFKETKQIINFCKTQTY